MGRFFVEHLEQFVIWGPRIFPWLIFIGLLGAWWLGRTDRFFLPKGWPARAVSFLLLGQAIASGVGLFCLNGALSPFSHTVATLRSNLNEKLPDLSFRLVADDSQHFLHEFEGRVVILNLWATWCPGCVREMPSLNQLQSDCASQGCVVLTISDESADRLRTFARSHPTNTVNGYVDRFDWVQMGTFRPFTLIVDGRGILREYAFEEVDSGRYEAKARRYLH